ncbi:hypothetical protein AAULR_00825, partial [Lacticaseibacillus rhamnosus MTCC 5462]
ITRYAEIEERAEDEKIAIGQISLITMMNHPDDG